MKGQYRRFVIQNSKESKYSSAARIDGRIGSFSKCSCVISGANPFLLMSPQGILILALVGNIGISQVGIDWVPGRLTAKASVSF
mgnify:CR=1 FL=1